MRNFAPEMVYIDDKTDAFDLQEALQTISEQRRQQALRFKHEQGQRLCVAAYLLLKRALRDQEGILENPVFAYGPHGKPSIVGHPELHFSLSHCKEAAVCVLSRHPIGIDVESIGRYRETVAHYAMSDAEVARIEQAEHPDVEITSLGSYSPGVTARGSRNIWRQSSLPASVLNTRSSAERAARSPTPSSKRFTSMSASRRICQSAPSMPV